MTDDDEVQAVDVIGELLFRSKQRWILSNDREAEFRRTPFWRVRERRLLKTEIRRLRESAMEMLVDVADFHGMR